MTYQVLHVTVHGTQLQDRVRVEWTATLNEEGDIHDGCMDQRVSGFFQEQ